MGEGALSYRIPESPIHASLGCPYKTLNRTAEAPQTDRILPFGGVGSDQVLAGGVESAASNPFPWPTPSTAEYISLRMVWQPGSLRLVPVGPRYTGARLCMGVSVADAH